jgi:hypothetical protein
MAARIPPRIRPVLKNVDVAPSTMPRSLRALSVQLNCGERVIASDVHVKATIGVTMPQEPKILSRTRPLWATSIHLLIILRARVFLLCP